MFANLGQLGGKMKQLFLQLTEEQLKVVEATSEKVAWGPTTQEMDEITAMSNEYSKKRAILEKIFEQLRDTKVHWKVVYKSLLLVEHMCIHADMECVNFFRQNVGTVQGLRDGYKYRDDDGSDKGINVRKRAETVADLIQDEDLGAKREEGQAQKQKFTAAVGNVGGEQQSVGNSNPAPFSGLPKNSRFEAGFGSGSQQARQVAEQQQPRPAYRAPEPQPQKESSSEEQAPPQRTVPVPVRQPVKYQAPAAPQVVYAPAQPVRQAPQPVFQQPPPPKQVDLLEDLFGSEPPKSNPAPQVQAPVFQPAAPVQQPKAPAQPQVGKQAAKPNLSSLLDF